MKAEYQFPIDFAQIAKKNNGRVLVAISSLEADSTSPFLHPKIKGRYEKEIKGIELNNLVILKPGTIVGRDAGSTFSEYFSRLACWIAKVKAKEVAK